MKLPLLLVLLVSACSSPAPPPVFHQEVQADFFHLRHVDPTTSSWLKQPENMLRIHETLKRFGYRRLVSPATLAADSFLIQDVYIKQSLGGLLTQLAAGPEAEAPSAWVAGFWARRAAEGNTAATREIVEDLQRILVAYEQVPVRQERVDPLLLALLELEFGTQQRTEAVLRAHFEQLKALGLHQSAYNVLYERPEYPVLPDRAALAATLIPQPTPAPVVWFEDTAK